MHCSCNLTNGEGDVKVGYTWRIWKFMPRQSPELSCEPGLPPATPAVATSQFKGVQLWYANGR